MPRIPDVLLKSVVFLYSDPDAALRGDSAGASGFVVAVGGVNVLITNIHVVGGGCRTLRVPLTDGECNAVEIAEHLWTFHPDADDVAATRLELEPDWDLQALPWAAFAATKARLTELNMGVGDEVVMLGRFVTVEGQHRSQPLARFGNIAMMPGELVTDGRGMRVEAFLVEMRSLSGFSGSPVFVYMGPGTYRGDGRMMKFYEEAIGLIGIDTGHITSRRPIVAADGSASKDSGYVEENTGVAIAAPVWKIADVLETVTGQTPTR